MIDKKVSILSKDAFIWHIDKQNCSHLGVNHWGFPSSPDGKAFTYNAGDPGLIPGLGRSPGEGNGSPLQCSCLENPRDRGAWWATVHGVAKSQTRLSN